MKEHLEKQLNRYVIATFDIPTNYLIAKGNCTYSFIDNIQVATKFVRKKDADEVCASCAKVYKFKLVVLPLKVNYLLVENDDNLYLDNAATSRLSYDVKQYITSILDEYGNPSSTYRLGNESKQLINHSRELVKNFINAKYSEEIIFTSSGSASNTLAIKGLASNLENYVMYYSPISHKSMVKCCKDCKYNHELLINIDGSIDIEYLSKKLYDNRNEVNIVCIEAANSETGLIRDVKVISDLVHEYNGYIIVDFTGYIPSYKVDVQELGVDIATFSGHKLGSLKGVGVLYKRNDININTLIYGTQEYGLFAGTENVIGIASLGKAIELYDYSIINTFCRDYVYEQLFNKLSNCYLIGNILNRLPHNLYMCFKNINGSDLVALLDLDGIQVSTGSACNNGSKEPSIVLLKLGIPDEDIHSCIRITFSGLETKEQLDYLIERIILNVQMLRNQ